MWGAQCLLAVRRRFVVGSDVCDGERRWVFQIVMTFFPICHDRISICHDFCEFSRSFPVFRSPRLAHARVRVFPASLRRQAHREAVSWDCALR